jgi:uncharacterized protein
VEDRRTFLKSLAGLTASLLVQPQLAGAAQSDKWGEILPKRKLGSTGEEVTMLGLGGAHVSSFKEHAQAFIETAMEGGIRFFDTAASYSSGLSQRLYGQYLVPKYRDEVLILSKAEKFTKAHVLKQLDETLLSLGTDYIDFWQMHQVMDVADAETRINQGVLDAFIEAKQSGKVRFIGFSGHRDPRAHLKILETTDIFDVCQFPVSVADASYGSFTNSVIPELLKRNMGIISIKSLAAGGFFGGSTWFQSGSKPKICPDLMSVEEAIHYVWSLPVSVLITGPNHPDMLKEKIAFAKSFAGMTPGRREELIDKAAHLTSRAGVEFYKDNQLPEFEPVSGCKNWQYL